MPIKVKQSMEFIRQVSGIMRSGQGFGAMCMKKVEIVEADDGKCQANFKVGPEHLNEGGGLHGGFTATLVDIVTTLAVMTKNSPPGVSVDLHVSYLKSAKEGEEVIVDANTIKAGKNLAYLECFLRHKKDGSIIAKGTHTKFIGN